MSNLKAIKRVSTSSGSNNKLRIDGLIPAVLYGGKDPNKNISIEKKEIKNIINSDTFLSKVLELEIDGKKEKVIPRDVAFHVVSEEPVHIDFMRIVSGKKIILEIPVKFINHPDSPGLKRGGVLNIVRRKVELKCPAENIPDDIIVDLAGTDIGTSIKISSIKLADNVVPTIEDRDFVIATVAAPTVMKEPEKPTEGEAVADGAEGDAQTEGAEAATKDGEAPKKDDKAKEGVNKKPEDKKPADKK
ncbi:50S ribosomal protein L25/general stress protein Ctc [Pelagibacteraceae bacterium]|nr:50S ribosomal protein L25/general stress protein Ctc [Pelagibacteraceae bacterium]MDC0530260.1 50S ribosomal protein L25/general stress protein Ctc [Pelagibacteraceae bacterium]MDC0952515.1 50S ribosomal protein L25/general stress protein Ctc [Pelagibacteraceae bacterium]